MDGKTPLHKEDLLHTIVKILLPYQKKLQNAFDTSLSLLGDDSEVRRACMYAINSGGKRLRPAIVWMVAEALHSKANVDAAALSLEFFHVSSLVIDDLPCMDNDDLRRGVPTTHKAFSESTAILASFALTSAGFEALSSVKIADDRAYNVLKTLVARASRAVGGPGLIGGQCLDMNPPALSKETLEEIFDKKTCVLFDLAFVFGWLLGGGSFDAVERVATLARYFGRTFQILDDIEDMAQDKSAGKRINYAICFGLEEAKNEARRYIDLFSSLARELGLGASPLLSLASAMRP